MLGSRRLLGTTAMAMALVMPVGLLTAPPALADPSEWGRRSFAQQDPVAGRNLKVQPRKPDPAVKPGPPAKAAWPSPGSAEVDVPSASSPARSATARKAAPAGNLPIEVLAPDKAGKAQGRTQAGTDQASRVRVEVLEQKVARAAGVNGLAFTVARTDAAAPGRVRLRLDYSKFEQAFGGAYGARLQLMRLPDCAMTTPAKPECRTPIPLATANNAEAKTLSAEVEAAPAAESGSPAVASAQSNATLLVAAAGAESSQGTYNATSLNASATWSAGGSTGGFSWSYPMRVPAVPGGLTPKVEIAYSSASVDGRTSTTNGQPSWVGEGFDLWPGFIERRYKSCEDDGAPEDEWGNSPGDQCWGYDNATVTWGGKGGELIKASDGTWRTKADDGTKFEKLTSSSIDNGDDNGEYWKVTTTDGTQYYFGLNHAPGWVSGKPETNSTWTAPVFGDDAGEPCNNSAGFKDSWCHQAYRWNLDYVVDPGGNAILYTYGKETNHYGRNLKPEDETPYVRGGYLKTISYGLRSNDLFAKAPAQVTFTTSERCLPDSAFDCDPAKIGDNPDRWWDVPWDLNCNSGQECKETHGTVSPTFWSRKRLTKVTTQIIKPDASGYRPVDSWALGHQWGLADVERNFLLKEIEHTGHAATDGGGAVTLPKVTFHPVQMENRLDKTGDDILAYVRYRVGAIYDEVGGQIEINYSDTDCSLSDLPTPETNTTRCMPVIWTPPGKEDPITDWFHKYVVTSVTRVDRTGLSPHMTTKYEYVGDAAWHFDDDDGLTKEKEKTWSQWRGYGHVRTFTGDPADPATQTDTYYMRGMDGDRETKSGGEKSVTVSDGEGGTHTDHDALAGFALRTVQYTEPGGSVHTKTVNTPWRVQTASRTRSWGTITANVVNTGTTRTWTAKDGGGWLETRTDNTFKTSGPGVGRVASVNIGGDVTTGSDDKCVRTTYADNTDAWMLQYPSRVETVAVACSATVQRPAQVISDVRTYYDDRAYGVDPVKGRITKVEKLAGYDGDTPRYVTQAENSYDAYGRITQAKDALGQATTTTFTQTQGLTTKRTVTTPPATPGNASTALTSSEELDPAWSTPTRTTDANGQHTDLVYDGLGRLRKVWLPTESKDTNNPNHEFQYRIAEGEIVAVTTKTMTAAGGQRITGIELLDGWLRTRQTQSPTTTTDAGQARRLISDTFYDNRGQVVKTYAPYVADGAPTAELFGVTAPGAVETQTRVSYDGLGRKTVESTTVGNGEQPEQELWRTTYAYGGGNRVSVTPPSGGTPTAEISNAVGQVIERRQYKASTPTGDYDATAYTYTPAGEIASVTDPSGNVWTTTYDLRGRKIKTTDPDKGTSTFTYDDLDRIVSTTDARGKTVYSNYDGQNRVTDTRENAPDGTLLTSYTYDTAEGGKGKLATATRHHNGAQYTSAIEQYDDLGRATRSEVTIPAAEGALAGSYSSTITYNRDGTVKTYRPPYGGGLPYENLVYTYDEFSRQTQLTSTRGTYINAVRYRATGEPQRIEYGTPGKRTAQNFTYEYGTRRLDASLTEREGINGYARAATYNYTDSGNITSITDTSHDGVDNQCFTYDHLQRLTQAWAQGTTGACADEPTTAVLGGPAPYWHTFTYDKAGNRTKQVQHGIGGQPDTVSTYTYAQPGNGNRLNTATHTGPAGNRTATYGYDATGNTTAVTTTGDGPTTSTQTFDWNTEGELAKVSEQGNDVTFVYDAEGNRLIRKDPTGTTLYLPGGAELRVLSGATTATGTRYYSFANQTIAMRTSDGAVTYMAGDHQGTANIAVNATTQQLTTRRFTPFGNIRGFDEDATWPSDKGFLGGTQDPTGLTHLSAREYNPETGRFISVDPVINQADSQQMNGYTYANNNPTTHSDPTGLCPPDICGAGYVPVGHDGPLMTGGCGRECGSTRGSIRPSYSINRPIATRWGDQTVNAPNGAAYLLAYQRALTAAYNEHPNYYDLRNPDRLAEIPNRCTVNLACTPAELGNLGYIGLLICKFGGFKCNRMSSGEFIESAMGAWDGSWGRDGGMSPYMRARTAGLYGGVRTCSSFVPGTKVLMADGTHKDIEDVEVGDKVLATDPETGETSTQPVLGTITSKGDKNLTRITVANDAPRSRFETLGKTNASGSLIEESNTGVIIATDNHPFWVAGDINQWVEAADLKSGMWLRTSAGTYVQITATSKQTSPSKRVHNLTVSDLHTYYVLAGTTPILVHNCDEAGLAAAERAGSNFEKPGGATGALRVTDGAWFPEPLSSGGANIHSRIKGNPAPHTKPGFKHHLEGQAAALMRQNPGVRNATLYIHFRDPNAKREVCGACHDTLEDMLPPGASLTVVYRKADGSIFRSDPYVGNAN